MGAHLIEGSFQSDKFPDTPRNIVPVKVTDKLAQDLLWELAERYRDQDSEFTEDLHMALRIAGYEPGKTVVADMTVGEIANVAGEHIDKAVETGRRLWGNFVEKGGHWVGRGGKREDR
jgi:hypothetical protein